MSAVEIEASSWPILVFVYPKALSNEEALQFVGEVRQILFNQAPQQNFACISDLSRVDASSTDARARMQMAEAFKQLTQDIEARGGPLMVADARVVSSPLVRGLAAAMDWVRHQEEPVRYFATLGEAYAWAKLQLAGHAEVAREV